MPSDALRAGIKPFLGPAWSPQTEAITLQNFEIRADGTATPHLARANHMQVVRALWEHRPSELYARVQCPVLMIPALAPEPHDERTRDMLAAKRRNIALAEARLKRSQTIWMNDTIHDVPLQRPVELAEAIRHFALSL
jgi:pimeloyl-ACP methyl ester carboxylesterase